MPITIKSNTKTSSQTEKIVVVGFGWVGQANALALTRMGFDVFYYDIAPPKFHYRDKYRQLYKQIKPLEDLLQIDGPQTWYMVCVGDRVSEEGRQDISLIEKALESLRLAQGKVILRSTVLPKYLDQLPFHVYLPEFLHEVDAVEESLNPFIFVLGSKSEIAYPKFINQWEERACRVFKGTPEEAAHIKYLSNIWNALRIAFVNEFGDSIGLPQDEKQQKKIERVVDFLFEKKSYLRYGRGFGGHCLPKDTRAFVAYKEETRPSPLLRAIHESNNLHKQIEKDFVLPQWFSSWDYAAYRQGIRGFSGRLWQNLNSFRAAKSIRRFFKPAVQFFEPLAAKKSAPQLNETWEKLAKKNPYYYANPTKKRQNIDEFELRQSGEEDYLKYVAGDTLLQKLLSNLRNKSVLEIGTGVGRMTEFFSQDFKTVHSIDISPTMLAIARKRLNLFTNVNLVKSEGDNIPFPDKSFDIIFSYLVFIHLPSLALVQDYFKEIARTLRADGLAKIQLRTGASPYFWRWFYGISLSPEKADNLAKNTGLQIIKSEIENGKSIWLWLKQC